MTTLLTSTPSQADLDERFRRIVDDLTRRGFLAGGLSAAAVLGLAACGSDGKQSGAEVDPGTRVVDTAHGKVTIPSKPQRIASLDHYVDETLWDLGATNQIGCAYTVGASPRYAAPYAAVKKTTGTTGLDLEAIAALEPDLIVSLQYPYIDDAYDKLTAIAPTVVIPFKTWDVNSAAVADVTGLTGLADLKATYATKLAAVRAAHADLLASYRFDVLHGGVDEGKFWLIGLKSVIAPLLQDIGIQFARATAGTADGYQAVSYENLDQLADADALIYWSEFGSATPAMDGPQLVKQTGWKELPAVKAGRLLPIADFALGSYGDALAALDEIDHGLSSLETAR